MRRKTLRSMLTFVMTFAMLVSTLSVSALAYEGDSVQAANDLADAVVYADADATAAATAAATGVWRLADPANIQVGRSYIVVSEYGALANIGMTFPIPEQGRTDLTGMELAPVTITDGVITSAITPDMIWQFGPGNNTAAVSGELGAGVGFHLFNDAPGVNGGRFPLRRDGSLNNPTAPIMTTSMAVPNNQSLLLHVLDAEEKTVSLYYWGGPTAWNFALTGTEDAFTAIGRSGNIEQFLAQDIANAPLKLFEEVKEGVWHSIISSAGFNGSISPAPLSGYNWVQEGEDLTFTFTPAMGFEIDAVTVNGEVVEVTDNSYTFENVTASGARIHATFRPLAEAEAIPFYVFNDMFASGEFTTAVIIDLGENRTVNTADLNPEMFSVFANNRNAFGAQAAAFVGQRVVTRVYASTIREPIGYITPMPGRDAHLATPDSGRYIIIELEFWSPAGGLAHGGMTVAGSNTLELRYLINGNSALTLADGSVLSQVIFTQALYPVSDNGTGIIAPLIDQFVGGRISTPSEETTRTYLPYTIFINQEAEGPLPLFVYFHGGGRGPDLFSPLRTANGAAALAMPYWQAKYPSHILSPQGNHYGTTQALNQHLVGDNQPHLVAHRRYIAEYIEQMIDDGLVDPNRVYISGFSIGSRSAIAFMRDFPEMLAAVAPVASGHLPSNAWLDDNPEKAAIIENMPIWGHSHRLDDSQLGIGGSTGSAGYWRQHFTVPGSPGTTGRLRNTNITLLDTNATMPFPYFGWAWTPHESEAPTFANILGDGEGGMNASERWGPDQEEFADKHLFDWLFAQVRQVETDENLVRIPAVAPVDGIPYGRPVSQANPPNAVWTIGNFLPGQIPITTTKGRTMADVNWVINTTAIPPEMYSPARFEPQTFNVSGTVVLPYGVANTNDISLEVTIQVTVDGGKRVDVPWTDVRPDIDSGWDNATTIFVEDYIRRAANHPGMPDDPFAPTATAEADILWSDDNLYVRIRVTDDNISTVGANHTVDGAEVFLSEAAFRGAQSGVQAHQMNQYRLASTGDFSFRWNSVQTTIIGNDAWRRVARETDTGYEVFLAIPLLYNHGPVEGTTMLFDIMLNDATLPAVTRTAEISWNDPSWGGFSNSNGWGEITLVREGEARPSIVATSGHNGTISPTTVTGRVWVEYGTDKTFTFTPAFGFHVDTVYVNGVAVTVTGNTFTFENVTDHQTIHVTFRPDAASVGIPFIVYNDIFPASGMVPFVYTTAVIIDLGEGNSANLADISEDMFIVSATNTRLDGTTIVFEGERNITRAYVNTEPVPLGYIAPYPGSPDLVTATPASGRFIILELDFWGPSGPILAARADDGANSTLLNYRINVVRNLAVQTGGTSQTILPLFEQDAIVAPALDRFVPDRTNPGGPGDMRILIAIHEAYQEVGPLPLFVYNHGGGRAGPAGEVDRFAPLMTLSGAAVLSKLQMEHPGRFDAHIIATQGHANNQANRDAFMAYVEDMVERGLVDPDRIYMSGFSAGGGYTMGFVNNNPEFLAAAVPVGSGAIEFPTQAQIDANPEILNVALWFIMHRFEVIWNSGYIMYNLFQEDGLAASGQFRDISLSFLNCHAIVRFPFFGWSEGNTHETEGAAFGQYLGEMDVYFRFGEHHETFAELYIFDWMFAQRRGQQEEPELTLTFHLYSANQTVLDAFGDYATDEVDGIPVIVVPVVPGTPASTWEGFELLSNLGHIYGTAEQKGYAFWGWFDDEMLDYSGRIRDGLRRPTLVQWGEVTCPLADLLAQIEDATMDELLVLFGDGNIDLYGLWVRFGDVDDSSLVNMADLQLLQRFSNFGHLLPVVFSQAAADVMVDGEVNMMDLSLLQRYTNFGHLITVVLGERPQ